MYPNGYRLRIEADGSYQVMEGAYRPGFLQAVMTVVMKLLNIVRADRAYFGEKDYQQLKVVTEMAQEFFLPTKIIPCPTVREESGLAMSSRNTLLSRDARDKAAYLFRALTTDSEPSRGAVYARVPRIYGGVRRRALGQATCRGVSRRSASYRQCTGR